MHKSAFSVTNKPTIEELMAIFMKQLDEEKDLFIRLPGISSQKELSNYTNSLKRQSSSIYMRMKESGSSFLVAQDANKHWGLTLKNPQSYYLTTLMHGYMSSHDTPKHFQQADDSYTAALNLLNNASSNTQQPALKPATPSATSSNQSATPSTNQIFLSEVASQFPQGNEAMWFCTLPPRRAPHQRNNQPARPAAPEPMIEEVSPAQDIELKVADHGDGICITPASGTAEERAAKKANEALHFASATPDAAQNQQNQAPTP